jgi:hypothetical protein
LRPGFTARGICSPIPVPNPGPGALQEFRFQGLEASGIATLLFPRSHQIPLEFPGRHRHRKSRLLERPPHEERLEKADQALLKFAWS